MNQRAFQRQQREQAEAQRRRDRAKNQRRKLPVVSDDTRDAYTPSPSPFPLPLSSFSIAFNVSIEGALKPRPEPTHDTTRLDPFIGWKSLRVVLDNNGLALKGAGGVPYGVDAHAICNAWGSWTLLGKSQHEAPRWDCYCGFYGLAERPKEFEYGSFLAQVELFGTVIEGERGWRASRQRVLSLFALRRCAFVECSNVAEGFQVESDGSVWSSCADHALFGLGSLADLRAKLGTEVRWVEP